MRRAIMAIMDREKAFAVSFMEHVNQKNTVPFEVQAFTEPAALRACLEKRSVEILLISEKIPDEELSAKLRAWPIRLIVLLSESPEERCGGKNAAEDDLFFENENAVKNAWPKIYKYQASSEIIREVMELYAGLGDANGKKNGGTIVKPKTKTAGIFSPVGRSMKTALAMTLGQQLARRKPTLLINMETCSGFSELVFPDRGNSISDVIYYIRQGEQDLMPRIFPVIREFRGLSCLPPFETAEELFGMSPEEWRILLAAIRSASTYEVLILDMGELPLLYPELLEECDVIYIPEKSRDAPAGAKMREFGRILSSARLSPVKERIRRVQMPETIPPVAGDWFGSLLAGPVGKAAAECAARDNL